MSDKKQIIFETVKNQERFHGDLSFLNAAASYAQEKVAEMLPDFVHRYPSACSVDLMYRPEKNAALDLGSDWTSGFWTGMLWLSYEMTKNELYRAVAEAQYDDYKERYVSYDCLNHHDIGFIYIPSILAQYKMTGSEKSKKLCLKAAKLLSKRFCEKAGIIQVRDKDGQGNFIIDCSMNIPLLHWAARTTGERKYYHIALSHMRQTAACMVREDASTYQCFQVDEITGAPIGGWTGQGNADQSCWARGQAWIIYGLAISTRYTKETAFLDLCKKTANYFLNRLPGDLICNWDLMFEEEDAQRDSSAASAAACGLLELSGLLEADDPHRELYENAGISILRSLAEHYSTKGLKSNGLLQHGVYCKDKGQGGLGDDECCIWGDYFYLEGIRRLKGNWNPYW